MVERLFLAVPRGCLRFVIVVFPDHTHYFLSSVNNRFADNSRALPTTFTTERISFSFLLLCDYFYGQSFIQTFLSFFSTYSINVSIYHLQNEEMA